MCKFFWQQKCNHHFPELTRKKGLFKLWQSKFSYLIIAVTIFSGVMYLIQTNITATKGYQIKDLQMKIDNLQEDYKKLNLSYIQMQSMANIVGKVSKTDLVPVTNVEVINAEGSVAMK